MCLLCLLLECPKLDRGNLTVLTFDHGLRPGSRHDCQFVAAFCRRRGVPCEIVSLQVNKNLKGRSVETAARELRREVLNNKINSGDADFVLLAHHLGDQAESILMHLCRGCGIGGLVGMKAADGAYLRPLIDVPPAWLQRYAEENGIDYVTDETNTDISFDRNFIRHSVLPLLAQRYPVYRSLQRLSVNASDAVRYLNSTLDDKLYGGDGHTAYVSTAALDDEFAASMYINGALSSIGLYKDVTRAHVEAVRRLKDSRSGAVTCFLGVTARREYDKILFYRQEKLRVLPPQPFDLATGHRCIGCVKVEISALRNETYGQRAALKTAAKDGDHSVGYDSDKAKEGITAFFKVLYVDAAKMPADAVVRTRREGDEFVPYKGNRKKLKKYFIDKKIPLSWRDKLPLIAAGSEILMIPGLEISDRVKADAATVALYRVRLLDFLPITTAAADGIKETEKYED